MSGAEGHAAAAALGEPELERLARDLLAARRAARQLGRADEYPGLRDLDAGLRVAQMMQQQLLAEGVGVAGLKLGAPTAEAQHVLGLPGPLAEAIYEEWMFPSEARISLGDLVAPRLECEIAFRRRRGGWEPRACIEIADSRFGWGGVGGQVLADFALNGAIVHGSGLGLARETSFELRRNGAVVVGGPASVSAARHLAETAGTGAAFVSSGSLHPMIDLLPGEWVLRFDDGGEVAMTVEPVEDQRDSKETTDA